MKLRNKIAAITAAAMLAFTGVGFAAWTFTNHEVVENDPSNVITCAIETTNVKLFNGNTEIKDGDLYLVFDAPTSGITGKVAAGDGIFFSTAADGSTQIISLTVKANLNHVANNTHYNDDAYKGIFDDASELTDPHEYLVMTDGVLSADEVAISNSTNEVSVTYTLPTFDYTSAFGSAVTDAAHLADLFTGISLHLELGFELALA